jgi:hypothetical protein
MRNFRAITAVLATAFAVVLTAGPAVASPSSTQSPGVADLLHSWAATGQPSGGGTLDSLKGQQLTAALQGRPVVNARAEAQPAAAAYPACHGTFPSNGAANIVVQSSAVSGIPWGVNLTPANAQFGVVTLSAQIYADNRQANVYAPHTEPWNYQFHGPLPRTFQVIGGGSYKMPSGATVSFLFTWHSAAKPTQGGYAYLNCQFNV